MSTNQTKRILSEAESRMATQPDNGFTQAEHDEIDRVIKFMVAHDYKAWPEDADPALVAMVLDLDSRV